MQSLPWIVAIASVAWSCAPEPRDPATEPERATGTRATPDATTHSEPKSAADATPPEPNRGELLVATSSRACTTKRCPGQCCNVCGRVVWKLASDPDARIVARGVALPSLAASECALHYDLRAEGQKQGQRFVVSAVQPVPSERGRRRGTPGQLELRTHGGICTTRACEPSVRCCNNCYAIGWVPKPTLDSITWSGQVVLPTSGMDCDPFFDRVVTGTWLGPSAFEIESQAGAARLTR